MSQVDRNCAFARALSATISSEAPTLALFAVCKSGHLKPSATQCCLRRHFFAALKEPKQLRVDLVLER
jgi:hypothetical protein